ncbi:hypothetical protein [Streptomyces camelliae]|uniref:Secreted protein n=1 Tax=Streptomyces camelliae TaxID=3004093 RepID=A0ABY7P7Q4_9ACTN|nr:hypothetical protein [Streptomyces sp. HUAS 2-6]WBO66605.1 hypothetical protein O1G22_29285 [Streptomyces sp. HUAS 2-6]
MSTAMIVLIVIVAVVVVGAAVSLVLGGLGWYGRPGLKRRFGPEYERTVVRHGGDTMAARRELAARVRRHGDLRERPLDPAGREHYEARWTAVQEHFVDSPRQAVAEADGLLAELAAARGYPDGGHYEEQVAALSVHHADHVDGYRQVHRVARAGAGDAMTGTGSGTEQMRTALLGARPLFDDLTHPTGGSSAGAHRRRGEHHVGQDKWLRRHAPHRPHPPAAG